MSAGLRIPQGHRHRLAQTVRLLAVTGAMAVLTPVSGSWSPEPNRAGTPMARISVHGRMLYAGDQPWRGWGFNWGAGFAYAELDYFDDPTPARFTVLRAQLLTARRLGANSMRVFLELGQVMASADRPRRTALLALRRLLAPAERDRIYLDITGDLVWRPERVPAWYERLPDPARWAVQARFWTAVARTAHDSPAVLCYELTSEPVVGQGPRHYYGEEISGWTFVQSIADARGRDIKALARAWTAMLARAVRREDDRPVTIGLLPTFVGAFAPSNVADLLDMLVIHTSPTSDTDLESLRLVRGYAAVGKPLLLGETFILYCGGETERRLLLEANRYLAGTFEFFDGRDPNHMAVSTMTDAVYQASLRQFISLRPELLAIARPLAAPDRR